MTAANVDYDGSLSIAEDLMKAVGLNVYEKILCANLSNGQRFETYAIKGEKGSGSIVLNGAVARLGQVGDLLTIMSFAHVTCEEVGTWKPKMVLLADGNHISSKKTL